MVGDGGEERLEFAVCAEDEVGRDGFLFEGGEPAEEGGVRGGVAGARADGDGEFAAFETVHEGGVEDESERAWGGDDGRSGGGGWGGGGFGGGRGGGGTGFGFVAADAGDADGDGVFADAAVASGEIAGAEVFDVGAADDAETTGEGLAAGADDAFEETVGVIEFGDGACLPEGAGCFHGLPAADFHEPALVEFHETCHARGKAGVHG